MNLSFKWLCEHFKLSHLVFHVQALKLRIQIVIKHKPR